VREPRDLYRLPWSAANDPGGRIEVTKRCDLACSGCPLPEAAGDRPFEDVVKDIRVLREAGGFDAITIAGGEPLLYPRIVETVERIARAGLKPLILTRGASLTRGLAVELVRAGLIELLFHIDSGQRRPDWTGSSEADMNALRERCANLLWGLGGVRCGFVVVVRRETLGQTPDILGWCRARMHKVHDLALVASAGPDGRGIGPDEMLDVLAGRYPDLEPAAALEAASPGLPRRGLVAVPVGGRGRVYGALGPRTVELAQILRHLLKRRYGLPTMTPRVGRRTFFLAPFDGDVRRTLSTYLRTVAKDPLRLFEPVRDQPIVLGRPSGELGSGTDLCSGSTAASVCRAL
jgi:Radical SAM superfamily